MSSPTSSSPLICDLCRAIKPVDQFPVCKDPRDGDICITCRQSTVRCGGCSLRKESPAQYRHATKPNTLVKTCAECRDASTNYYNQSRRSINALRAIQRPRSPRRHVDIAAYDWKPHCGRYVHENFSVNGKYWREIHAALPPRVRTLVAPEACDTLNREQRLAYDAVMGHVHTRSTKHLLLQIDGGSGTGKSYLIHILAAHIRAELGDDAVEVTAPTGVVSSNVDGKTLHALLRLPVQRSYSALTGPKMMHAQLTVGKLKYLIIDEKSMIGLSMLGQMHRRLTEIFAGSMNPHGRVLGGLNIIMLGDFFKPFPVGQKPLFTRRPAAPAQEMTGQDMSAMNILAQAAAPAPRGPERQLLTRSDDENFGFAAYQAFRHSVFLQVAQRQQGELQAPFRAALEEMREMRVSDSSFELLVSRVSAQLTAAERASFDAAIRIFPRRDEVTDFNYTHLASLNRPVIQVHASHHGNGAEKAESRVAGNLSAKLHLCPGARIMLLRNISPELHLVHGSRGTIYDLGWEPNVDPLETPPLVVMATFDEYTGRPYVDINGHELRDSEGCAVVPILRVAQDFMLKETSCRRYQFPITVCYATTIHKAQGITVDQVVVRIAEPKFAHQPEFVHWPNYVACSRVRSLAGLMIEDPFERRHFDKIILEHHIEGERDRMVDLEHRKRHHTFYDPSAVF